MRKARESIRLEFTRDQALMCYDCIKRVSDEADGDEPNDVKRRRRSLLMKFAKALS